MHKFKIDCISQHKYCLKCNMTKVVWIQNNLLNKLTHSFDITLLFIRWILTMYTDATDALHWYAHDPFNIWVWIVGCQTLKPQVETANVSDISQHPYQDYPIQISTISLLFKRDRVNVKLNYLCLLRFMYTFSLEYS